jgi:peptidoglycan/xylan/chitin deacetylase (PgdA/CDA1 family)
VKAICFQYHDIINPGEFNASGFPGSGPASYKIEKDEFEEQMLTLRRILTINPVTVPEVFASSARSIVVLLTFDDGGISAFSHILDILDKYGWKAHFFITTNYIGTPTFLTKEQIRSLRMKGHIVGSHSCSHPQRMSCQSWDELLREWTTSLKCLSDILGEEVTTASVPHGYYSDKVAKTAALSGVKALFTSEPVRDTHNVGDCMVFGRYVIRPGIQHDLISQLVRGGNWVWRKEYLFWNAKKFAKVVGGKAYLKLRDQVLHQSSR